jgi:hypothetical protein
MYCWLLRPQGQGLSSRITSGRGRQWLQPGFVGIAVGGEVGDRGLRGNEVGEYTHTTGLLDLPTLLSEG